MATNHWIGDFPPRRKYGMLLPRTCSPRDDPLYVLSIIKEMRDKLTDLQKRVRELEEK